LNNKKSKKGEGYKWIREVVERSWQPSENFTDSERQGFRTALDGKTTRMNNEMTMIYQEGTPWDLWHPWRDRSLYSIHPP
jgi:hypothetical protein